MTRKPTLFEREPAELRDFLLHQARSVRAPHGAKERTLRRIAGVSMGVGVSSGTASALGAAVTHASASLLAKGVLLGLCTSLTAFGVGSWVVDATRPSPAPTATQPTPPVEAASPRPSSLGSTEVVPRSASSASNEALAVDSARAEASRPSAERRGELENAADVEQAAAASAPAATGATQLEREVAHLRRTRAALASGDPRAALESLDRYTSEVGAGVLRAEAAALRVEATAAAGQSERASELALEFSRRYPTSPLEARVQTFVRPAK